MKRYSLLIFNSIAINMTGFLYNLFIYLYEILLYSAHFFNYKAKKLYEGRVLSYSELSKNLYQHNYSIAWFHCASLGEFEQARPLIENFRKNFKTYKILLTFYSSSGYDIQKNYIHADFVAYMSHDSHRKASQFIDLVKPSLFFLIKYEFWLNHLKLLTESSCKVFLVSAVFKKNFIFFKTYGAVFLNILRKIDYIFVQDNDSKSLLNQYNVDNCFVAGDTRIDNVLQIKKTKKSLNNVKLFCQNKPTLILGSVWESDLKVIASTLNTFDKVLKIIIAPHDISSSNLKKITAFFKNKKTIKYSETDFSFFSTKSNQQIDFLINCDILLIDNIGLLSSLYAYADFAYIGGGFGKGLHNTLEPASYYIPVIVGPKFQKFNEIIDLVANNSFFEVSNKKEFKKRVYKLYTEAKLRNLIASQIKKYLDSHQGASLKIIDYLYSNM